MAQINELAPNTATNHQGRLAYVPDNLLPKTITGPIFQKAQESSLALRLGSPIPVTFGETVIPVTTKRPEVGQVGTGTSNAQREGGVKPISGTAWSSKSFQPIKIATIVTFSEEFAKTNPQGFYDQIRTDLAFAIGRGIDLAVFHGKQPLTGTALQGIDTTNVIANTTNVVKFLVSPGTVYEDLLAGYDLVANNPDFEFNGWAVDPRFRSTLVKEAAARDMSGKTLNPGAIDLSAQVSDVLGFPAYYGRAVSGQLGAATDTGLRVIGGDFSQLRIGFADSIRYKFTDTASISDGTNTVNLWQTNQAALLVEVTFGWVLGDKQAFVKFDNVTAT
ncbi:MULTISPECIES: phage major capsid protein [Nocardia]|uniref:Phage major capsid protein n=1 Tax=Nocardia iowensis TaxID=204891 RepID=A0ABX8RW50_NOCIO|nr:phage major capsid protein [Nocardia iowensis]QXN92570.1 phage major capsid protein [Nocardia iowensis]